MIYVRPGEWRCWNCNLWVSNIELLHNDGDCPYCEVEIDTTDFPYTEDEDND